ncbi:1,4-dihydroxy-2-naphthoate polyprenyltransferase [hydrothermal vent metagenome]|uniref:1,4-dihydroxy-2-naphthoate polyprenyltransferase n=1 Tax=hydrothermal vent metagenome TaxID=652676 RepID=A0A3B1AUM6_9ZZZZ
MIKYWLRAIRPKTLSMAIAPVLAGTTLAWYEQHLFSLTPLLLTLAAALLIQIGTNLYNDVADFERGVDSANRTGPIRVVAEGLIQPARVRHAAWLSLALALGCGIYLVWLGGWPIFIIGLLSLVAAYAYTGGSHPIAYGPFGEFFVLIFFGVIAVAGSAYLQTGIWSAAAIVTGVAIGLPASAALLVNNYRDLETDCDAGRRTLVSYLGRRVSGRLYAVLLLIPLLLVPPLIPAQRIFLPWLALPLALLIIRLFWRSPVDAGLNRILAFTAQYQLLLAILFAISWLF